MTTDTEERLIDSKELHRLIPFSRQYILRLEKAGKFPKRRKLGERKVAWRHSEIETWMRERDHA